VELINDGISLVGEKVQDQFSDFFGLHKVVLFYIGADILDQFSIDTAGA
jgi:hypothetical protein